LKQVWIAGATLAVAGMGVAAALVVPALGAPSKVVTVRVTAREFKFTLSRSSVPVGTVIFEVTNKGKIGHNFKIGGKVTPLIKPGKTVSLKVVFKKKGRMPYICALAGHGTAGMKGTLGVGVKAPLTTTASRTTTVAGPSTTVTVNMDEYHFALSQSTVPQGNVTFVVKNVGQETHNFDLQGKHIGGFLDPGQSERWTVNLPARTYDYVCDVPYHAASGMEGDLMVTG
jgi:uncharacterized cupredoxin-like copper-binding protein